MKIQNSIIKTAFFLAILFIILMPVSSYSEEDNFMNYLSEEEKAAYLDHEITDVELKEISFYCQKLGVNEADFIDKRLKGEVNLINLENQYLSSLGYDERFVVTKDDKYTYQYYYKYDVNMEQVIKEESCYSNEELESKMFTGDVIYPEYDIVFVPCKCNFGMRTEIHNMESLDKAIEANKKIAKENGLDKFRIEYNPNGGELHEFGVVTDFYLNGELFYKSIRSVDEEGSTYGLIQGPNGEELSLEEQINISYAYLQLSEAEILLDKKYYADSIYYRYRLLYGDTKEAYEKYQELLKNFDNLSIGKLNIMLNEATEAVVKKKEEEGKNKQKDTQPENAQVNDENSNEADESNDKIVKVTDNKIVLTDKNTQKISGSVAKINGKTPTKIMTRVINGCPVIDFFDDEMHDLGGCSVFDTEHTKYKYVAIDYMLQFDNGGLAVDLHGTNEFVDPKDFRGSQTSDYENEYGGYNKGTFYSDDIDGGDDPFLSSYEDYYPQDSYEDEYEE